MPMPALKSARHELFAQLICEGAKRGWSHGAAYSRAGYKAEGHAAEVAASRLLKNVENGIAARVQEIVGRGARRAEVTVESLLNELDDVLAGAMSSGQYAAARAAIDSKARLKGLFVDRVEVGAADPFRDCDTGDEVIDKVIAEAGGAHVLLEQLREFAEKIEHRAALTAVVVPERTKPPKARLLTADTLQRK
jgi:hypothetical protein